MNVAVGFDNATLQGNLEALAVHQPELAERLRATPPPEGAQIVTGRDGATVVQLGADAERVEWLGGTSMPTISSGPLLAGFDAPHENVALPTVGSGYEPAALARRLAAHAAVFVCEPNPALVVCALAVADWSEPLRAGRIVVLTDDLRSALTRFLEQHPGYLAPSRVYPLPIVAPAELAERSAALQSAGQEATAAQLQQAVRLTQQIHRRQLRQACGAPRLLVLSTDALGGAVGFSRHVVNALTAMGCVAEACVPEAPTRCHRLARLTALRDHEPDGVLFLNAAPGPLREALPPELPRACWFLDVGPLPANAFDGLADGGPIFATSTALAESLRKTGAKQVSVLEPGVDDTVFHPVEGAAPAGLACDIAVLGDGCDLAAAANGIGLESHERLWKATIELLGQALRSGPAPSTEALLAQAESRTGIRLTEPEQRTQLLTLMAVRLAPTVIARTAIEALEKLGGVAVWGRGWEAHERVRPLHRGPIPGPDERNRIYQAARVVVLPVADQAALRRHLEVLAAGGTPLAPPWPRNVRTLYPALEHLLNSSRSFASMADLRRQAAGDGRQVGGEDAVSSQRSKVLSQHTLRERLGSICAALKTNIS